ncbi:PQQ-binding-like beta-propeller repeat protein, partial [Verrucomicrobiota bacterium]
PYGSSLSTTSGSSPCEPSAKIKRRWDVDLGTRITQPVVVGDKVFVAAPETHSILCLNAKNGAILWASTSGGRIDTPPTYYRGTLLFGSADGWVYSVDSATGKLRWRFRCAPEERRIGSFGQLESAWPVAGSILVKDDIAYAAAGRSSLIDGGIHLYALNPETGKELHHVVISEPPVPGEDQKGTTYFFPGVQSDVLVSDGENIYLRHRKFSPTLESLKTDHIKTEHLSFLRKTGLRLYASSGFTDDSFNNRVYWLVGENYGNIMAFDAATTFGVKMYRRRRAGQFWSLDFVPAQDGYLIYSAPSREMEKKITESGTTMKIEGPGAFFTGLNEKHIWDATVPVRIQAMAAADKTLWVAGPPDVVDKEDPYGAYEGRKGGIVAAFAKDSGKKLTEFKIDSPPIFDGISIAGNRVYLSLKDGTLVCLGQNN